MSRKNFNSYDGKNSLATKKDSFGIPSLSYSHTGKEILHSNLVTSDQKSTIGMHMMFSMPKKYEMYNLVSHPLGSMVISAMESVTPLPTKTVLDKLVDIIMSGANLEINYETTYEKSLIDEITPILNKSSRSQQKTELLEVLTKLNTCLFFSSDVYIIPIMTGSNLWLQIIDKSSAFIFKNIKGIFVAM